jgi:hypothetical protein
MKIHALITCHKFARRLGACLPYWAKVHEELSEFKMTVISPKPILHVDSPPFVSWMVVQEAIKPGCCESKGIMLRRAIDSMRKSPPTHVLFTDADIIPPPGLAEALKKIHAPYAVADRVDLGQIMTELFLSNGSLPPTIALRGMPRTPKKRGMGWFQLVKWEALSSITPATDWTRQGYDVLDWEMDRDLAARYSRELVMTENPFIHLWHGNPGSTWKGTDKEW